MKRRVVVTGLGAVSPIGQTVEENWNSIKNNVCGIDFIDTFDTSDYKTKLAGQVKNFENRYFSVKDFKFNDRFTQFARTAAREAMEDSGLLESNFDRDRMGVIIASGVGGLDSMEKTSLTLNQNGVRLGVSPFFIPMVLINLVPGTVAIDYGIHGISSSVVTACAAGSNAIGEAFLKIRDGYLDACITGGTESSITTLGIAGFEAMKALHFGDDKNRASIPFDKDRSGFVMGEGAGILILEELEHAKARGAKIYAEVVGYGSATDAYHITKPDTEATYVCKAITEALAMADIKPSDVNYLNCHGTSTHFNDLTEATAIKKVFGEKNDLLVSSTKSNTGHLLGASGAIEAIYSVLALKDSLVPATINITNYDSDLGINVVCNENIKKDLTYTMSNSLGFGGHNVSLIFKKWEE